MSEHDSTCARGTSPLPHFVEWFRNSGCKIHRPGAYGVTITEVVTAYEAFCRTGHNRQLELLDALRLGTCSDVLTEDELEAYREINRGESVWCDFLPPDMARELAEAEAHYRHVATYEFRRIEASRAIADMELRRRIFERDGYACRVCKATNDLCLDHILPVVKGGGDSEDNLQLLCRPCNSRKGGR